MAFFFLTVYTVFLLIRPHEWGMGANPQFSPIANSLIVCMLLFLFHKNKNLNSPQLPIIGILLFSIIASLLSWGWFTGARFYAEEFLKTAFIPFLLVSAFLDTRAKQNIVFLIIVAAALIMVWNGYTQTTSASGIGMVGNQIYQRFDDVRITYLGYFADPNDLGMYLVMAVPVMFFFHYKFPVLLRFITWGGIVALLFGIYLTNSRGTLLATIGLIFFWFWRKYGTPKSVFLGLLASPGVLFIMGSFRTISADDASSQGRLDAWYSGYEMFKSSPIFGVGQYQFTEYHGQTAHNSFVLVMAELGLLGALAWVGIIVVSIVTLLNIAQKKYIPAGVRVSEFQMSQATAESKIAITLLFGLVAFLISGFFLSRSYLPWFFFHIGMASACFGRVQSIFPQINNLYDVNKITKLTFMYTFGCIIFVYLLLKIFL